LRLKCVARWARTATMEDQATKGTMAFERSGYSGGKDREKPKFEKTWEAHGVDQHRGQNKLQKEEGKLKKKTEKVDVAGRKETIRAGKNFSDPK